MKIGAWAIIGIFGLVSLQMLTALPPAADEMEFIRITDNLPEYRSYPEWWSLDGKTHPGADNPVAYQDFDTAYAIPIWHHPPMANILAWPFVKAFYSEATLDSIKAGVVALRVVAWAMIMASVIGIYYVLRKRTDNQTVIGIAMLPFLAILPFFREFGNNWFYHDTFMVLTLVGALVIRETQYKRFVYIPLALMVTTKLYAVVFLIPFIFENRKTALCALALVPYLVWVYLRTGNVLFPVQHFYQLGDLRSTFPHIILNRVTAVVYGSKMAWTLLIFTIPAYVYAWIKREWFCVAFTTFALIFGLAWWGAYYQMLPIAIITPIMVCMFVGRWLVAKPVVLGAQYDKTVA